MTYPETFGIAAFRSRQQVMRFDSALKRAGIKSEVISTPRDVSLGCGLSVRFDLRDAQSVMNIYRRSHPENLIGFYRADQERNGRLTVTPLAV